MKYILTLFILLITTSIFSQVEVDSFFLSLKLEKYEKAYAIASKSNLKEPLLFHYNLITSPDSTIIKEPKFSETKNSYQNILYNLNKGLYAYIKKGDELKSIKLFKKALKEAKKINNEVLACEAIRLILEMYQRFTSVIGDDSYNFFLNEYKVIAYDDFEKNVYVLKKFVLENKFINPITEKNNSELIDLRKKTTSIKSKRFRSEAFIAFSIYYQHVSQDLIKSEEEIKFALKTIEKPISIFSIERKLAAQINLAIVKHKLSNHSASKRILDSINLNSNTYIIQLLNSYLLFWKSKVYKSLNYDLESKIYENESLKTELLLNHSKQLQLVSEYETKYQTAEKEKQILLEQQKKKQNRNIAFGLAGLLLFGSITFLLIQKNTKRKQLLAEQEKELQVQKVGTLMKEQELASIDAMIEGQEKERQRIANDLHDDLGGMMATVKLHFNTLKDKPSPELYTKTDKLLDEAYQKIRSIAHAKNSGVIAKHGLLKSINDMAQKVSSTGKIKIDVVDHGLENRLENSLELTIFRVIQELITNVIKHANASEATIHLTQHEDSLNIMVEDNGKGFNPKKLKKDKGMGISSIDKRVDHLNGSLNIESDKGQGTTIIIDIPL